VQRNGASSNSISLPPAQSMVEILALGNDDGKPNSAERAAKPGSIVTVYAAGFGQTQPASVDGQVNGSGMRSPVSGPIIVQIGEEDAEILYAGPAPGQVAGIMQINFRVPQLAPGQYTVSVGLVSGNGDYDVINLYVNQ